MTAGSQPVAVTDCYGSGSRSGRAHVLIDEYPGKGFLSNPEVMKLLAYKDRKEWVAFLRANPTFPKRVSVGKTRAGKPRLMYPKHAVYSWIESNCTPEGA
jgi:predicted DNA-binding transcriptional regulator AlpA